MNLLTLLLALFSLFTLTLTLAHPTDPNSAITDTLFVDCGRACTVYLDHCVKSHAWDWCMKNVLCPHWACNRCSWVKCM
ncbi:hypothetical protein P154DRAFT_575463 [Amniculicola lignicola CBS 123094]|uniref:Uncharacterized protein n=1 Tax=Amniculicola lignicola CBS 123094 TaxID=1392246 RepID=A0A6A5WPT5_9PLEO|nr:hypothetical protein P154DRAFT_575463 [Amniculicola lignicola CBS 123094]